MPTSKRDIIKLKHRAIINALTRCIGWTKELYTTFENPHPNYAQGYAGILAMLEQTRDFVEKMRSFI